MDKDTGHGFAHVCICVPAVLEMGKEREKIFRADCV